MKKLVTLIGIGILWGSMLNFPARAQFEAPLLSKVQPNLVNPGGKSIAMGGAFVSIADDATAAIANPAGLPQLSKYEVGISGKYFSFTPTLNSTSWIQNGNNYEILGVSQDYKPTGSVTDLEFASFVIPISNRFSVAAYYGTNLRYKIDTSKTFSGDFRSFSITKDASGVLSIDEMGVFEMRNEMFGVSAGYRYRMVSFGGGINFNRLKYDLTGPGTGGQHLFLVNQDNLDSQGNQNLGTALAYRTDVSVNVESGTEIGWVLGLKADLYEPNSVAVGVSYRKAARYDVGYSVRAYTNKNVTLADFGCGRSTGDAVQNASACGKVGIPDDLSIGISGSPVERLMLALEFQRVWYSNLNNGYVPLFRYSLGTPGAYAVSDGRTDDGNVWRAGAEYTFILPSNGRLSLRAGYYYEPAHGMKVEFYNDLNNDRRPDSNTPVEIKPYSDAYRELFNGSQAENHISGGVGYAPTSSWAFDVAFDSSKSSTYAVLSAFYRWGSPK